MKNQTSQDATTVAANQVTVSGVQMPQWKVNGLVALGQKCLEEKRAAIKARKQAERERIAAEQLARQQQLDLEEKLQAVAKAHGISFEQLLAAAKPRANSATETPSKSAISVNGQLLTPCKAVHAICDANATLERKAILELCVNAGINKATAATQFNIWKQERKANEVTVVQPAQ